MDTKCCNSFNSWWDISLWSAISQTNPAIPNRFLYPGSPQSCKIQELSFSKDYVRTSILTLILTNMVVGSHHMADWLRGVQRAYFPAFILGTFWYVARLWRRRASLIMIGPLVFVGGVRRILEVLTHVYGWKRHPVTCFKSGICSAFFRYWLKFTCSSMFETKKREK